VVTPSTFRFRARWRALPEVERADGEPVPVKIDDTPGAVRLRSKFLDVAIRKHGCWCAFAGGWNAVDVRFVRAGTGGGRRHVGPPGAARRGVLWLGPAPIRVSVCAASGAYRDPVLDLDGGVWRVSRRRWLVPFRFHRGGPLPDCGAGHRLPLLLRSTPKEIFKEHSAVRAGRNGQRARRRALRLVEHLRPRCCEWCTALCRRARAEFDLTPYAGAPPELVERARQLGSLVPKVRAGAVGLSDFRKQLESFFAVYALEIRDMATHLAPASFQYPDDAEGARHADEFMLGDEMLIAPVYEPGGRRAVYLPRGSGRTSKPTRSSRASAPLWCKANRCRLGAQRLDCAAGFAAGIDLHYFPKLGAEFFLLESDIGNYSQVHAAPAADIVRLEIEARKDRNYQWWYTTSRSPRGRVPGCQVPGGGFARCDGRRHVFYDAARKNLHVRRR